MKYIVEIEEWENTQMEYRKLGQRDVLNFILYALTQASWCDKKETQGAINKFLCEYGSRNNEGTIDRRGNPMLSIISAINSYYNMSQYFTETSPEKFKEFFDKKEII
jgi:hypothetical protein